MVPLLAEAATAGLSSFSASSTSAVGTGMPTSPASSLCPASASGPSRSGRPSATTGRLGPTADAPAMAAVGLAILTTSPDLVASLARSRLLLVGTCDGVPSATLGPSPTTTEGYAVLGTGDVSSPGTDIGTTFVAVVTPGLAVVHGRLSTAVVGTPTSIADVVRAMDGVMGLVIISVGGRHDGAPTDLSAVLTSGTASCTAVAVLKGPASF